MTKGPEGSTGEPTGYFVVKSGSNSLLVDEAPWWLRSWMKAYRRTYDHPRLQGIMPRPMRTFVRRGLVERSWTSDHPESLLVQRHWELAVRTDPEMCWRFVRKRDDVTGAVEVTGCPKDATWRGEVLVGTRRQVVDACGDHTDGLRNLRKIIG